jgi:hypothetical protein
LPTAGCIDERDAVSEHLPEEIEAWLDEQVAKYGEEEVWRQLKAVLTHRGFIDARSS